VDSHELVKFPVQSNVVFWILVFPRGGSGEGASDECGFAPSGDYYAIRGAVRSLAPEFFADFAVDFRGDEDAAAGFGREVNESGEAAGVVGFGEGETAERGFVDAFRSTADGSGWKIEPCRWDIASVMVGVLAGVAGDVGELEGNAEVDGVVGGGGIGGTEDAGHHESDRAGHAVAVAQEGAFVGEDGRAGVVAERAGQGDGGRGVGIFQREIKRGERVGSVVVFEGGSDSFDLRGVAGFVGEVIESPAESVELRGGGATLGREKFSGEVEAFAGAGQEFCGSAHAARRRRFSTTLAELRTPGIPAPGWVPAPTK
jgi:hypothetical protein